MAFHVGYMGFCRLTPTTGGTGTVLKITGSSLNPVQAINAPELVQGEYNKKAWNYGPIETGGNVTGPLGEATAANLTDYAWYRDNDYGDIMANQIDVEIYYYKASTNNSGRKFNGCQINSYALSVTAGDVATFTADFFGKDVQIVANTEALSDPTLVACERLITWDQCSIEADAIASITDFDDQIQGWSITINNNLKRIYRVGQADLFPVEILAGIRDITGSLTVYADTGNAALLDKLGVQPYAGANQWSDYAVGGTWSMIFKISTLISLDLLCTFARTEANAMTDTMTYTVNFTGLCNDYQTTPT